MIEYFFPKAQGSEVTDAALVLRERIPDFSGPSFDASYRRFYGDAAFRFVTALRQHAPGGLVDAIFGELAHQKASIFKVADPSSLEGKPCPHPRDTQGRCSWCGWARPPLEEFDHLKRENADLKKQLSDLQTIHDHYRSLAGRVIEAAKGFR